MVIRRRLFVMMSVMAVSSLLMLLLFWLMLQRNISGVMTSRNKDTHATLERIIELEGRGIAGLAYDYSFWTEMVDFVGSADETWAEQNLDTALESFRCDACWVYKPDFDLVAFRKVEGIDLEAHDIPKAMSRAALECEKFPHWFAKIGTDIVEFRGAPIQPTEDTKRVTPAQGYFVVARVWGDAQIDLFVDLFAASDVSILDGGPDHEKDGSHGDPASCMHIYDLPGIGGAHGIYLRVGTSSPAIDQLVQANGFVSVGVSIMLVLMVSFFVIGLSLWVSVPISMMSEALEKKDSSLVSTLVSQKSEIGRLAELIRAFFLQQSELEKEIAHRKERQRQQSRMNSILRIWGRCNFAIATCSSEDDLLKKVCKTVVDEGGYGAAWVGNVTWTGGVSSVKVLSKGGNDHGYLDELRRDLAGDALKGSNIVGRAIRLKDVAVCRSVDGENHVNEAWKSEASKRGIKSMACFPMMHQGEVFSVFGILSEEPGDLDVEERRILAEVMDNLGSGIMLFRSEKAREAAERRAADLSEQLMRTQKLEAVGRLAGGIAHDFNNLLFVMMGNLELALEDAGTVTSRKDLAEALEAGKQASQLTRQLLSLGRKKVSVAEPVRLNDEIRNALDIMKSTLKESVDVQLSLDANAGVILGDPVQIRQIFINAAVNAGEAMPGGGVFKISTESVCVEGDFAPEAVAGDYVLVTLSDTGKGMDEEVLAHVFEPFFTTKEDGTGLGLSLVNSIATQHGGFIRASSVKDAGTTFRIFLPITDVLPGSEGDVASLEALKTKGGESVLLVEDRDMCRLLTKTMLESLGYKVVEAVDGKDAIEKIASSEVDIDVIVTDVVMPGMSGPEMVQKLRDFGSKARVVYMSGYADGVLAEHGLTGTRVGLLQKPFMLAQLAQIVRDALMKRE